MFEAELQYFIDHQQELLQQYRGKVLVLKDAQIVGVYQNVLEAYTNAQKSFELGSFMIQLCEPGAEAYTVTISLTKIKTQFPQDNSFQKARELLEKFRTPNRKHCTLTVGELNAYLG